ncbi:hypothetical protein [Ruminiclostridium cellulolyticum]|uniref:Uncharacterized protein n=1 Tax=Ruminiclostridium cellulolyticum (strain ATCC 35319 / DSM 5812 / JCM 6584 / H10) TaxID=394503 RepID=B8I0D3_RUMCH|nr:hypothetical protein [Ruminiclostridium cellulolyticum]ACL77459.1 hypothetical protein Ccel_3168 [Ruminiclostridium cellulolyticum H10]
MFKCNKCKFYGDERSAGLINHCFNEDLTEEEHDKYRNKGEGNCPCYIEDNDVN